MQSILVVLNEILLRDAKKDQEHPGDRLHPIVDCLIELKNHPWFVASQFHPEFKSRPEKPHPLFLGFMKTILGLPLSSLKEELKITDEAI